MLTLALDVMSRNLITIAVLAVLFIALYLFTRYSKTDNDRLADQLQKKYAVMTPALLAEIPDDELAEAVVANVLAKQDRHRPDLYTDLPQQTPGRCAVTVAWLIDRELDNTDFETLFTSRHAELVLLAADSLDRLGAPACAAAVRAAQETQDAAVRAECHADYIEAREQEDLPQKLVAYIRDNPGEFLDNPADEEG